MRAALRTWEGHLTLRRRRAALMTNLRDPRPGRALRSWMAFTHRQKLGATALRRLIFQGVARALHAWAARAAARRRARRQLQRTLGRMTSPLARPWSQWAAYARRAGEARRQVRQVLGRALRPEARALLRWREAAAEHKQTQMVARRAYGRWARPEARALTTWRAAAAEKREARQKLLRAAQAIRGGELVRGWQQFKRRVEELRAERIAMGGVATRWANQALAWAWDTWREAAEAARRARAVATRWANSGLTRAFRSWASQADVRRAARRALSFWQGGLLRRVFEAWCAFGPGGKGRAPRRWRRLRAFLDAVKWVATHPREDVHILTHPVQTYRRRSSIREVRDADFTGGGNYGGGAAPVRRRHTIAVAPTGSRRSLDTRSVLSCRLDRPTSPLGAPLSPAASADRTKGARFAGSRAGCSSASVAPAPPTLQARHSMPAASKPRECAGPPRQLLPREGPGPRPALADDDPPLISYPQTIPSPQEEPPPREVREASMTALLRADQHREAERAQRAAEGVARAQSVTFVGQCPTLTPVA